MRSEYLVLWILSKWIKSEECYQQHLPPESHHGARRFTGQRRPLVHLVWSPPHPHSSTFTQAPQAHAVHVRAEQRRCTGLVFTERGVSCAHAPKYCRCRCSVSLGIYAHSGLDPLATQQLKKKCPPLHIYYWWAIIWSSVILDYTDDFICKQ